MTKKKERIELGRKIRKVTGIKLPAAFRIARELLRCEYAIIEKNFAFCNYELVPRGCDCGCYYVKITVTGPKGIFYY